MKQLLLFLAILFLFTLPAYAAIGSGEAVAEIVSTSNAATYDFGSFTPTANATHIIIAFGRGTVDDGVITNVSGTPLVWQRFGSAAFNAGADTSYVFWARTNGTVGASVYRVDFTGDNATGCAAYFFTFTGADQTTAVPIRQAAFNSAASTNATGTFALALLTGSGYCAGWMGGLSSSNPANVSTPPTSWTEIGDNGFGSPTSNASGAHRAGGETTTTVTFTNATTTWGFAAVEVYEAGAGPIGGKKRSTVWM